MLFHVKLDGFSKVIFCSTDDPFCIGQAEIPVEILGSSEFVDPFFIKVISNKKDQNPSVFPASPGFIVAVKNSSSIRDLFLHLQGQFAARMTVEFPVKFIRDMEVVHCSCEDVTKLGTAELVDANLRSNLPDLMKVKSPMPIGSGTNVKIHMLPMSSELREYLGANSSTTDTLPDDRFNSKHRLQQEQLADSRLQAAIVESIEEVSTECDIDYDEGFEL